LNFESAHLKYAVCFCNQIQSFVIATKIPRISKCLKNNVIPRQKVKAVFLKYLKDLGQFLEKV